MVHPLGVITQAAIRLVALRPVLVNPILPVQPFIQIDFEGPTRVWIVHGNNFHGNVRRTIDVIGHQTARQSVELIPWEVEETCCMCREVVTSQSVLRRRWSARHAEGGDFIGRRIITDIRFRHRHIHIACAIIASSQRQRCRDGHGAPDVVCAYGYNSAVLDALRIVNGWSRRIAYYNRKAVIRAVATCIRCRQGNEVFVVSTAVFTDDLAAFCDGCCAARIRCGCRVGQLFTIVGLVTRCLCEFRRRRVHHGECSRRARGVATGICRGEHHRHRACSTAIGN